MGEGGFFKRLVGAAGVALATEQMAEASPVQERAPQEHGEHVVDPEAAFASLTAEYRADNQWDEHAGTTKIMVEKLGAAADLSLEPLQDAELTRMSCYGQARLVELTVGGYQPTAISGDANAWFQARENMYHALREAPAHDRQAAFETLRQCYGELQEAVSVFEQNLDGQAEEKKLALVLLLSRDIQTDMEQLVVNNPEVQAKMDSALAEIQKIIGPQVGVMVQKFGGATQVKFGEGVQSSLTIGYDVFEGKATCKLAVIDEKVKQMLEQKVSKDPNVLLRR